MAKKLILLLMILALTGFIPREALGSVYQQDQEQAIRDIFKAYAQAVKEMNFEILESFFTSETWEQVNTRELSEEEIREAKRLNETMEWVIKIKSCNESEAVVNFITTNENARIVQSAWMQEYTLSKTDAGWIISGAKVVNRFSTELTVTTDNMRYLATAIEKYISKNESIGAPKTDSMQQLFATLLEAGSIGDWQEDQINNGWGNLFHYWYDTSGNNPDFWRITSLGSDNLPGGKEEDEIDITVGRSSSGVQWGGLLADEVRKHKNPIDSIK